MFRPTDGSARNLSYHLMQRRDSNPRQRVAPDWDLFKDNTAPQQLKLDIKYSKVPKAQSFEFYISLMDGSLQSIVSGIGPFLKSPR